MSLRDIARHVGMQAPSIYSYFASKNDIYDAMFADGFREFAEGRAALPLGKTPLAGLRASAHYFVDFCTADAVRYQLMFQRTIPGFVPSPESYAISVGSFQMLVDFFTDDDLAVPGAIDMYTAIVTGITDQQISNDPGGDRWSRLVDDSVDMLLAWIERQKKPKKGSRP